MNKKYARREAPLYFLPEQIGRKGIRRRSAGRRGERPSFEAVPDIRPLPSNGDRPAAAISPWLPFYFPIETSVTSKMRVDWGGIIALPSP